MDGKKSNKRIYSPQEVSDPIERHRRSADDLCAVLRDAIRRTAGPLGVFPQNVIWRRLYSREAYHERLFVPGGLVVARALELLCGGHGVSELVFGVDVQEKCLVWGAGVIVGCWTGSWQIGAINYRVSPHFVMPIDWHNRAAISYMQNLILLYEQKRKADKPTTPFVINK